MSSPESVVVDRAFQEILGQMENLHLFLNQREKLDCVEFGLAFGLADLVKRRLQKVGGVHAGDFDRVLEGQEHPGARSLLGSHVEKVLAAVKNAAFGHFIAFATRQDGRQRALAAAVGPHDGVHLSRVDGQVHALEDFFVFHSGVQVFYFKYWLVHFVSRISDRSKIV